MVVLSSPRIAQEAHEVGDLLFGNAVVVKRSDLIELAVAAVVTFSFTRLLFKGFLFSSFDPDTARVFGVPVKRMELVLHLRSRLHRRRHARAGGAAGVRVLGSAGGRRAALFRAAEGGAGAAAAIGIVCAALGYYLSWTFSLPTGSVMVALAVCFWVLAGAKRLMER